MSRDPFVVIDAAEKRYVTQVGVVEALHPVSAEVPAGSITAVVGVSGSGKSTLLRLLAGSSLPTAGRVAVGGSDLATLGGNALRRFRRETVAYVSQRAADNLFPHLTIDEHVPGASRAIFERLGVSHRLHARASQLSGGELARAAFGVALARGAPVVIVDEPTAELDDESAATLLDEIRLHEGTTFLVATHDPDVLAICDQVVQLERGRAAAPVAAAPRTTGEVVLQARGVTKAYDGAPVVSNATVELHAGELAVIVGRSGSGKSTLLMVLAGWQRADSGAVPAPGAWEELAYVPQRFGLLSELTVRENVELPARLRHVAGRTDELLELLELSALADRYPAEASIGQQQRAAVARALCLSPRVLLVDEPTSHQDAASAERVWAVLAAAAAAGTACLVATHEPDAARRADTAWAIDDGRLAALG